MPEALYQLTQAGKRKLKRLLEDSGCGKRMNRGREIWTRLEIQKMTGLDRETVQRIVQAVDPDAKPEDLGLPVQENSLIQLFQKLGARQKEFNPCKLWREVEVSDTLSKRPEKLASLLRNLDYTEQQPIFDRSLRESPGAAAFLIPTPCIRTQRWIINRLAYSVNNADRALRTRLINVESHPIRARGVDALWGELAMKLKLQTAKREEILQKLFQETRNRPVIIALYNFGEEDVTPQKVIEEFWKPLLEKLPSGTPRSARSRIVLLIADRNVHQYCSESLTLLPPLKGITAKDVEEWLQRSADVYPWCREEFGAGWVEQLMQNKISGEQWKWDRPGSALDQICFSFGLANGINDLQRKWEWT